MKTIPSPAPPRNRRGLTARIPAATREPFVVEDATTHPLVKDIPLVHLDGVRCYAGIPLVTSRGHTVGTLCVIGHEARTFGEDEIQMLRGLARRAMERIEARRG